MYPDPQSRSAKLYARAREVVADGVSRTTIAMHPYPLYVTGGDGARIRDVDGNELIDFNNNYTSLIHGHARPEITEAVSAQLQHGAAFSFGTEAEIELAELLCARVPGFERIRFCNSGTEAVMNAIKAARAHTGRAKIAKCEGAYHGSYDYAEISLGVGPDHWGDAAQPAAVAYSKGTPQRAMDDVVVIPFNDIVASQRLIEENADQLACVLFDPVSSQVGMVGPAPGYLEMLRDVTRRHGILLVFDEVIAFRLGHGGAQQAYGVSPDITALGKIIGGGFPVGAVAGTAEAMAVFERNGGKAALPHGGTFNANPVTMVAGRAAMALMDETAFADLNALGERLRSQLREAFVLANEEGQVSGEGSLFKMHLHSRPLTGYREAWARPAEQARMAAIQRQLMNAGLFVSPTGLGCLSTAMSGAELDRLSEALVEALRATREGT